MSVLLQAALPTARTIRWWPLVVVVVPVAGLVALARSVGRPAGAVLLLGAAALASLVVTALRDDAAVTLEALPVSIARRSALRLALMGAPVLLAWWSLLEVAGTTRPGTASLLVLATCGTAVATRGASRWAVLAGAAVPVVWFAADRVVGGRGTLGEVLGWWRTDPWPVLLVVLLVCLVPVVARVVGGQR
jgi:hypothetical protein